jgi:hypothetical protein
VRTRTQQPCWHNYLSHHAHLRECFSRKHLLSVCVHTNPPTHTHTHTHLHPHPHMCVCSVRPLHSLFQGVYGEYRRSWHDSNPLAREAPRKRRREGGSAADGLPSNAIVRVCVRACVRACVCVCARPSIRQLLTHAHDTRACACACTRIQRSCTRTRTPLPLSLFVRLRWMMPKLLMSRGPRQTKCSEPQNNRNSKELSFRYLECFHSCFHQ